MIIAVWYNQNGMVVLRLSGNLHYSIANVWTLSFIFVLFYICNHFFFNWTRTFITKITICHWTRHETMAAPTNIRWESMTWHICSDKIFVTKICQQMCFPSSLIFRYVVINHNPRIVCSDYSIWLPCAGRPKMFTTSSETYAATLAFHQRGDKTAPFPALGLVYRPAIFTPLTNQSELKS